MTKTSITLAIASYIIIAAFAVQMPNPLGFM
jgi:hypothetical protein